MDTSDTTSPPSPSPGRVLVLAPMPTELKPTAKRLKLTAQPDGSFAGTVGRSEVVAGLIGIGPEAAEAATRRLVEAHAPDHLVVCGVAGGIGTHIRIGDLIVPHEVIDLRDGKAHHASPLGAARPKGKLVMAGELIHDRSMFDDFAHEGIEAVDMETAVVAVVAEEHDLPWTAFRGISDHVDHDVVDEHTMGLMHPDGSPNLKAVARYAARRPSNVTRLVKLGRGLSAATGAATTALRTALTH